MDLGVSAPLRARIDQELRAEAVEVVAREVIRDILEQRCRSLAEVALEPGRLLGPVEAPVLGQRLAVACG